MTATLVLLAVLVLGGVLLEWLEPDAATSWQTVWAFTLIGGGVLLLGSAAVLALRAGPASQFAAVTGVTLAGAAALTWGGPLATAILRQADPNVKPGQSAAPGGPADPNVLLNGGWVGLLERLAVVGTLRSGWPEGVAVILAVKGVGRYPELRDPGGQAAAERFIIGTLASVLWAAACAGVAHLVLV